MIAREQKHFIPRVPMSVFRRICLHGSAGFVFLLWRRARVEKSATVTVSTAMLRACGFSRKVKAAAPVTLEEAGLVVVHRQCGKNPEVTLLVAPELSGVRSRRPARKRGAEVVEDRLGVSYGNTHGNDHRTTRQTQPERDW